MHKLSFGRSGRRKPIVPARLKKVCVGQRKLNGYVIKCFKIGVVRACYVFKSPSTLTTLTVYREVYPPVIPYFCLA